MNKLILFFASGFGTGYAPKAPGTAGSLVGLGIFWVLKDIGFPLLVLASLLLTLFAVYISTSAEKIWGQKDCQKIVIDEVAGQFIACLFIAPTWASFLIVFGFFRMCDVVKVFPASWAQNKLPRGWGIVMDDVFAGLQAGLLFFILFNWRT